MGAEVDVALLPDGALVTQQGGGTGERELLHAREEEQVDDRGTRREDRLRQQRWHGWASPIGLGLGLLCVGGFFWLVTLGRSVLSSID